MSQTTRLAAIMFIDIVGYTGMMQRDREQAMQAVKSFEAVLRDRISVHKGELIQTYGDGSLSIFDSASAAVQCAREIQEAIRDTVPLRIGLHTGEITRDGDHTFGDGVNIASRIESMGVAGSVLLSSSIRQQIKNKPEFQLQSLGKFAFKNVAEPMTVYALANEFSNERLVYQTLDLFVSLSERRRSVLAQRKSGKSQRICQDGN